jgi:hypothetical protein
LARRRTLRPGSGRPGPARRQGHGGGGNVPHPGCSRRRGGSPAWRRTAAGQSAGVDPCLRRQGLDVEADRLPASKATVRAWVRRLALAMELASVVVVDRAVAASGRLETGLDLPAAGRCSARTATESASTPRSSRRPTRPLPCGTPLASWCFSPRTRCLMPAEHGKPSGQVLAQSPSMMACNPGWPSSRSAWSSQVGSSSYHRPGSGPMPAGSSTCRC